MDRWLETEVFAKIAEVGSVTAAAEALGLSVSATSRYLIALEERLKVRLIQRTTRTLYLTSEGERFLARCREAMSSLLEAEASISAVAAEPAGLLRVSASLSFCLLHLAPLASEFMKRYPQVTLEVVASNRYYDLIENGVDIAIRTRQVESDSSITIRRLAETRRLVAASPAYLEKYGSPGHPQDLTAHRLLLYTLADSWDEMRFRRGVDFTVVRVGGVVSSNDGQVLRAAAIQGDGILFQPTYIIERDLREGSLVRLLDDWDLPRLTMNLAFPTKINLPAKTRLFIDFLVKEFKEREYEALWTR